MSFSNGTLKEPVNHRLQAIVNAERGSRQSILNREDKNPLWNKLLGIYQRERFFDDSAIKGISIAELRSPEEELSRARIIGAEEGASTQKRQVALYRVMLSRLAKIENLASR